MSTPVDYRKMTPKQLDAAIMYAVQYGTDLGRLNHLLAARGYRDNKTAKEA